MNPLQEMEKAYLQRLCDLTLKQINNWFINERKRHWNSEERSMYPNPKFNDDEAPGEGTGLLEHLKTRAGSKPPFESSG